MLFADQLGFDWVRAFLLMMIEASVLDLRHCVTTRDLLPHFFILGFGNGGIRYAVIQFDFSFLFQ